MPIADSGIAGGGGSNIVTQYTATFPNRLGSGVEGYVEPTQVPNPLITVRKCCVTAGVGLTDCNW